MRRIAGLLAAVVLAASWLPAGAVAEETASLGGTVRSAGGEALDGATITVVAEGCAAGGPSCAEPLTTSSDETGDWLVEVPPGDYHVHVADPAGASADQWWDARVASPDVVTVAAGEQRTDLDAGLAPAAAVVGQVLDHAGVPIAGARASTSRTVFSQVEGTTGDRGMFRLDGLAGRTYTIEISGPVAGLGRLSATVVLADGEEHRLDAHLPLLGLQVVRVAGADRVATAVAASQEAFASAGTVVVASSGSFPDALAAAPVAAALQAPLLLTGPSLPGAVAEEIGRLGASEAVVVGAIGAVPLLVQEQLRELGLDVRRFAGETRFDTAALLGREIATEGGEVVLASGAAFPDALSAAPLAAAAGLPILLSASASLVDDTAAVLQDLGVTRVLVIGGGAAISGAVTDQLPQPRRLWGPERYATSVAVAEELLRRGGDLGTVYAATGNDFPDALAAGPVAALTQGPVLLVDGSGGAGSPATLDFLRTHGASIGAVWVFGGTAAVSQSTLDSMVQARGQP